MKLSIYGKLTCLILLLGNTAVQAQQVNIESLKDILKAKPLTISGGLSANNIFNSADVDRPESLSYCFQGNMNANLFGQINLPFSYSLTNAGASHTQPVPPNRLELHPTYKWISTHIGQVAMSFSPYTLNGHQFTGGGIDLTPPGRWKFSAMGGRLVKAINPDPINPKAIPSYQRMGYGTKIGYQKDGLRLGISAFYAKDDLKSVLYKSDTSPIYPKQNLAIGYVAQFKPMAGMDVNIEYATSALILNDNEKEHTTNRNYLQVLMGTRKSTAVYHAIKSAINYTFNKVTLGVGYEHVDPNYRTLGGYFFNNDFENVTANIAHAFFNSKVNMALNVGLQYDNLDGKKSQTTKRTVGSVNMNCNLTDKVQLTTSYSNFKTFMLQSELQAGSRPIAAGSIQSPKDFVQISQNANVNVSVNTRKNEFQTHLLNVNLGFQDAADEKGGIVSKGNGSQFYTLTSSYNVIYLKKLMSVMSVYNVNYNTVGRKQMLTHGPTINVTNKLLQKKLETSLSVAYNISTQDGITQNDTFNIRVNGAYSVLKSHSLNLNLVNQCRSTQGKPFVNTFTGTLGYRYSF